MNTLGKNLAIEANLVISATNKEQAKLRPSCHPFPLHAGEHHGAKISSVKDTSAPHFCHHSPNL